jgi:hypothetical protein
MRVPSAVISQSSNRIGWNHVPPSPAGFNPAAANRLATSCAARS